MVWTKLLYAKYIIPINAIKITVVHLLDQSHLHSLALALRIVLQS